MKLSHGMLLAGTLLATPLASAADTPAKGEATKQQTVTWLNEHSDWLLIHAESKDSDGQEVVYHVQPKWNEDCSVQINAFYQVFPRSGKTYELQFVGKVNLSKLVAQDVKAEDFTYDRAKVSSGLRFKPPASSTSCEDKDKCYTDLLRGIPFKPNYLSERERYQNAVRHLIKVCGGSTNDVF